MKIKSIDTGQEFSKPSEAIDWYCHNFGCAVCPLLGRVPDDLLCENVLVDDFEGALRKMGLEVVHDKPRLCEILRVEPGEVFRFNGYTYMANEYLHDENGRDLGDEYNLMCWMINHPEKIEHLRHWTADDIADAKAIKLLCPTATTIFRNEFSVDVEDAKGRGLTVLKDRDDRPIIPSAHAYESVNLDDILNQAGGAK